MAGKLDFRFGCSKFHRFTLKYYYHGWRMLEFEIFGELLSYLLNHKISNWQRLIIYGISYLVFICYNFYNSY